MKIFFTFLITFFSLPAFCQTRLELDSLTKILESVYERDQTTRNQLDTIENKYGYSSIQHKEQWKIIKKCDSNNIQTVSLILNKYGWLSVRQTSEKANSALFLVVQHADLEYQIKYIDVLKKAIEKGKAKPTQYAYLFDRVNMRQGKFQIYGTQVSVNTNGKKYYYPIKDVYKVNKRRKKIGLPPLAELTAQQGQIYNFPVANILRNKIVVTGFVFQKDQTPLDGVKINFGSKTFAVTNSDGFYIATIEKKILKEQLGFTKEGYTLSEPPLNDDGKDVYELNIILTRK